MYPVNVIDDPESNRQAHIPFTPEYWTAVGTMLARRARTLLSQPYKVIAVDADNTLWGGGVVGEAGAAGVRVDGEWKKIQEFLRQLKAQGMLLAMASKNRRKDVAEVFKREDMDASPGRFRSLENELESKVGQYRRAGKGTGTRSGQFYFSGR